MIRASERAGGPGYAVRGSCAGCGRGSESAAAYVPDDRREEAPGSLEDAEKRLRGYMARDGWHSADHVLCLGCQGYPRELWEGRR